MKKRKTVNLILILLIILGIGLMIYPSFSNYWNIKRTTSVISTYNSKTENILSDDRNEIIENAIAYNELLATSNPSLGLLSNSLKEIYEESLDITGTGVMGYIKIPVINVTLPIYHGTEETVLTVGVGHIEWSSLPVGGMSSHSVISGHRGLPSAKLFTDIDRLTEGDLFFIEVLGEEYAYEVDQINIVTPENIDLLKIEPGRDLCTLVTCTPYGVNTHRLLVRGHRTDASSKAMNITLDATQIKPVFVASAIAIPILLIMFVYVMLKK